jgi:hypothetical protein
MESVAQFVRIEIGGTLQNLSFTYHQIAWVGILMVLNNLHSLLTENVD